MLSSREADVANSHYATDRLVAIAVALGVIADMARAPEMVAFDPSRHFGRLNCCAAKWCLASSSDRIEGNSAHLGKALSSSRSSVRAAPVIRLLGRSS